MAYASTSHSINAAAASCCADPYTLTEPQRHGKAALENARTPEQRHREIAEAAYFLAERRGFGPGCELQDWLAAEHEVNARYGLLEPHPNWDRSI
jgi:hypothetical protein